MSQAVKKLLYGEGHQFGTLSVEAFLRIVAKDHIVYYRDGDPSETLERAAELSDRARLQHAKKNLLHRKRELARWRGLTDEEKRKELDGSMADEDWQAEREAYERAVENNKIIRAMIGRIKGWNPPKDHVQLKANALAQLEDELVNAVWPPEVLYTSDKVTDDELADWELRLVEDVNEASDVIITMETYNKWVQDLLSSLRVQGLA